MTAPGYRRRRRRKSLHAVHAPFSGMTGGHGDAGGALTRHDTAAQRDHHGTPVWSGPITPNAVDRETARLHDQRVAQWDALERPRP